MAGKRPLIISEEAFLHSQKYRAPVHPLQLFIKEPAVASKAGSSLAKLAVMLVPPRRHCLPFWLWPTLLAKLNLSLHQGGLI